jgi:hypothetical protein
MLRPGPACAAGGRRPLTRLRGFAKGAGAFSLAGAAPGGVGLHYTKGRLVQWLRSAVGTAAARC